MNRTYGIMRRKHGIYILMCLVIAILPCAAADAESLWDPDFKGYIVDGSGVRIGTTLVVRITPSTELTLKSAHIDSTEGLLSFSGGSGSGLFDFLPHVSTGTSRELEQESSYNLETLLSALVTDRDESGLFYLEGERSLSINGSTEKLSVKGWFSPQQVQPDGSLSFDVMHKSILEYSSPGLETGQVLLPEDITEPVEQTVSPVEEGLTENVPPAGTSPNEETVPALDTAGIDDTSPGIGEKGAGTPGSGGYELTDEKQKQLLLQFFNRFLSTIFTP